MGQKEINERARETGKTQEEVLREAALVLGLIPERKGPRKWVELVRRSLHRPTEADRENRRIFEENQRRSFTEALEKDRAESAANSMAPFSGKILDRQEMAEIDAAIARRSRG